jgi:hypothetical protein
MMMNVDTTPAVADHSIRNGQQMLLHSPSDGQCNLRAGAAAILSQNQSAAHVYFGVRSSQMDKKSVIGVKLMKVCNLHPVDKSPTAKNYSLVISVT